VVIEHLMTLASAADMSQVRAVATAALQQRMATLSKGAADPAAAAHQQLLATDIRRFLDRPAGPATRTAIPTAPPGAPIGDPAMDWLRRMEPPCSVWEAGVW
jgi:hypothetical protein